MLDATQDIHSADDPNKGAATSARALTHYKPGPEAILEQDFEGTLEKIRMLGSCWLTRNQMAAKMRVSRNTLWRFMRKFPEAEEAYQAGLDDGDADLSAAQKFAACNRLDSGMLKWIGQHRLNQREKTQHEVVVRHENTLDKVRRLELEGKL